MARSFRLQWHRWNWCGGGQWSWPVIKVPPVAIPDNRMATGTVAAKAVQLRSLAKLIIKNNY